MIKPPDPSPTHILLPLFFSQSLVVEQKLDRVGRAGVSVSIHSLALDPLNPHLFITGGSDPLVRLFDLRMMHGRGERAVGLGFRSGSSWVSCFVPEHLKEGLLRPPVWYSLSNRKIKTISGVAFSHGGGEILATYNSENIYSFRADSHARFGLGHTFGSGMRPILNPHTGCQESRGIVLLVARLWAGAGGGRGRGGGPSAQALGHILDPIQRPHG